MALWLKSRLQGERTVTACVYLWSRRAKVVVTEVDGAILRTKQNYTNPQSKRLFRGEGATPERIAKMDLKGSGFK